MKKNLDLMGFTCKLMIKELQSPKPLMSEKRQEVFRAIPCKQK